jgi:hypothetical protein
MADMVLGPHTSRLGRIFKDLIAHSNLHPFTGPIRDTGGEIRVQRGDIPTLLDIQNMRWLCDIISE